jgi:hypothetical protein
MSLDRWKVVKGLFQRAIKLSPNDWSAYLDSVCAGDEVLRRDVASLLAEHEPDARPLLRPCSSDEVTLRAVQLRSSEQTVGQDTAPEEPTDA